MALPARWAGAVVAGLFAAALATLVPAAPALAAPDGESIPSYDTAITVTRDGRLAVVETIMYDFAGNQRHGIERTIPVRFRYNDRSDRIYPISDVSVTVDGSPVPLNRSTNGGNEVLRIGDPNRTVSGRHSYAISYTVGPTTGG
jgi:Predicted membrane protein (DUF2207)